MLREMRLSVPLRMTALSVVTGALVAGCEPGPTDNENQELSRAQEAAPLRDEQNQQAQQGQAQQGQAASERESAQPEQRTDVTAAPAGGDQPMRARAMLEPAQDSQVNGTVEFEAAAGGQGVMIVAMVEGLEAGSHGFHIHETGDCSAPTSDSAGEHFDRDDGPHGSPEDDPAARHTGDLGNLEADDSGMAETRITVEELELEGEYGIVGRAVIVHENRDDLESQPGGESGDPVACGVIRMSNDGETRREETRQEQSRAPAAD